MDKIKIRDTRDGWLQMSNKFFDIYGEIFGSAGIAVYVSLCRYANNETQGCFPSQNLISKKIGLSKPTVIKYIKMLKDWNIIRIEKNKEENNSWANNIYYLLDTTQWIIPNGFQEEEKENPKEKNKNEVNELIYLFRDINPCYNTLFKNTTERKSLERMIKNKEIGFEKLKKIIKNLPKTNKQEYFPVITSPYLLERKYATLMSALNRENNWDVSSVKPKEGINYDEGTVVINT